MVGFAAPTWDTCLPPFSSVHFWSSWSCPTLSWPSWLFPARLSYPHSLLPGQGGIQGESLAARASVGPRVGILARWHLLHKLPLAGPCRSQSSPPLPPGPHPSSAEPGLALGDCTPPEGPLPPCRFLKPTRFLERLWGGKKRVSVSVTGKQERGEATSLPPALTPTSCDSAGGTGRTQLPGRLHSLQTARLPPAGGNLWARWWFLLPLFRVPEALSLGDPLTFLTLWFRKPLLGGAAYPSSQGPLPPLCPHIWPHSG